MEFFTAYKPMLMNALEMFLFLGIELSVLFILISAGVSLLQQYIPDTKIQSILGGSNKVRGYFLAAILGAVTPFCSCSTIPMLRGLLRARAGFGPTLTFLFTSPLLNPIILGIFFITFGFHVTCVYTLVALVVSIVAGIILEGMGFEKHVKTESATAPTSSCCGTNAAAPNPTVTPAPQAAPCCCDSSPQPTLQPMPMQTLQPLQHPPTAPAAETSSCCASTAKAEASSCCSSAPHMPASEAKFSSKVSAAFHDAWGQFKHVFPYLALGVSLGALIYGFVPSEFIATYASGDSIFAVPIAAIIGIPLYVRVEALIPLSAVLVNKGMGLGAVMALIIGGGGASLTELILLKSFFRTPMIMAFLVVILGMAMVAGYLFQYIL